MLSFTGFWQDGTTMAISSRDRMQGQEAIRESVFSWKTPDEIHARQAVTIGGIQGPVTEYFMMQER
jgi:hypothetical protein